MSRAEERSFQWPNKARIAVAITCVLETWPEGKGPPFAIQTTALKPGTPDRSGVAWSKYGVNSGVWRLLKILDAHGVPATFAANARALELNPAAARQIVASGHEVAGHSYTQDDVLAYMTADEQREHIRRCKEVTHSICGIAPVGWISPVLASTEDTLGILAQEEFVWFGDYNNIDLPFCVASDAGKVVALAHSDFPDHRVLRSNTQDWYEVYQSTFDYLYQNESPSFLNITVHSHFGGRPLMAAQIDKILRYIRGFPDAWIVRHDDLAKWVLDNDIQPWSNGERFYPQAQ